MRARRITAASLAATAPKSNGTKPSDLSLPRMPKESSTVPKPEPAEPSDPPVKDPQPYTDPVKPPPGDPKEEEPLRDPIPPGHDQPRAIKDRANSWSADAHRARKAPPEGSMFNLLALFRSSTIDGIHFIERKDPQELWAVLAKYRGRVWRYASHHQAECRIRRVN